jgi:hypothetical protein
MSALPAMLSLKAAAIAGAASLALGLAGGWKLHDALVLGPHLLADARAAAKAAAAAREAERRGGSVAGEVRDAHDTAQAQIRTVTSTIVREVPRYVSPTVKCPASKPGEPLRVAVADVSVGFGLLHDAAARGAAPLPPAAGVDLDAPRGTGMPAALTVIAANYGVCRGWREEARSWREWYVRERGVWGG